MTDGIDDQERLRHLGLHLHFYLQSTPCSKKATQGLVNLWPDILAYWNKRLAIQYQILCDATSTSREELSGVDIVSEPLGNRLFALLAHFLDEWKIGTEQPPNRVPHRTIDN